jgi:hypothetical protein
MKKVLYNTTIIFILLIILGITLSLGFSNVVALGENATMTVEVDIIGFNSTSGGEISIEVPDYIDLGEVSKNDLVSDEEGIWINNTGIVDIRVTPQLNDPEEEIFKYLYFRKQTSTVTNNTDLILFKKIGDYYIDINKPTTGKSYRAEHCYMQLNLSDFNGVIKEDVNNYQADIVFLATAR